MAEIELGYGRETVSLTFDETRWQVLAGSMNSDRPLTDFEIGESLSRPIESEPLEEIVDPGDSVLIVVSDATRATASAQILNLLVRRLIQTGISPSDIAIIFATGIHRPVTSAEKIELLTPFIAQRVKTIDHNPSDSSQMVHLGETDRGTPVEVNRALKDYSKVIITGGIGFHYFAGFTGGRKSICPGLASTLTIESTHKLVFDFETGGRRECVDTALLAGNAVHEECEQITAMVAPAFGINSIVDDRGRAVGIFAGDWRAAHSEGCSTYLSAHSTSINSKREAVIVSCGGSPYDINLIQAHKALDMAAHACVEGGTIILLAECTDGFGRNDFLKWFEVKDSHQLALRLRDEYEVNGQTAWSLLTKAERYQIYLVSTLADEDVHRMRMTRARSLDDALDNLKLDSSGYIMPRGAAVLPQIN